MGNGNVIPVIVRAEFQCVGPPNLCEVILQLVRLSLLQDHRVKCSQSVVVEADFRPILISGAGLFIDTPSVGYCEAERLESRPRPCR